MNQKIEWYKEVLALEPGSKVFFPLARMQAENGLSEEALATLRQGLGRNPEHIEARLLLIDLLFGAGQHEALWPELDQIALMLGGYPGFWSAWNARLARNPSSKDAALALSFFSASLRGEAISWTDVIEHGLRRLLSGEEAMPVASSPKVAPPELDELKSYLKDSPVAQDSPRAGRAAPAVVLGAMGDLPKDSAAPGKPAAEPASLDLEPLFPEPLDIPEYKPEHKPEQQLDQADENIAPESFFDEEGDSPDADDVFSLKTRSMAEVLAEQGDYAGALDIYNDLLRQTEDQVEKQELEEAIAALSAKAGESIGQGAAPGSQASADDEEEDSPAPAGQGKNRLLDVLDALAKRLENRAN